MNEANCIRKINSDGNSNLIFYKKFIHLVFFISRNFFLSFLLVSMSTQRVKTASSSFTIWSGRWGNLVFQVNRKFLLLVVYFCSFFPFSPSLLPISFTSFHHFISEYVIVFEFEAMSSCNGWETFHKWEQTEKKLGKLYASSFTVVFDRKWKLFKKNLLSGFSCHSATCSWIRLKIESLKLSVFWTVAQSSPPLHSISVPLCTSLYGL